jgi:uncharacterized membrane protein YheB (UPF0754 family)
MLFDRIPGLIGSGVVPARFREIRAKIRHMILAHFFNDAQLRGFLAERRNGFSIHHYLKGNGQGAGVVARMIDQQWDRIAAPQVIQPIVDLQIEKLMDSSIGGLLVMVGVENVRPAVSQFVTGFVGGLKGKVLELSAGLEKDVRIELDEDKVIEDIRANVDLLLNAKLQQLDAQTVKRMLEEVIRKHLGWLVVWGNVFGGVLGLVALLLQRYF